MLLNGFRNSSNLEPGIWLLSVATWSNCSREVAKRPCWDRRPFRYDRYATKAKREWKSWKMDEVGMNLEKKLENTDWNSKLKKHPKWFFSKGGSKPSWPCWRQSSAARCVLKTLFFLCKPQHVMSCVKTFGGSCEDSKTLQNAWFECRHSCSECMFQCSRGYGQWIHDDRWWERGGGGRWRWMTLDHFGWVKAIPHFCGLGISHRDLYCHHHHHIITRISPLGLKILIQSGCSSDSTDQHSFSEHAWASRSLQTSWGLRWGTWRTQWFGSGGWNLNFGKPALAHGKQIVCLPSVVQMSKSLTVWLKTIVEVMKKTFEAISFWMSIGFSLKIQHAVFGCAVHLFDESHVGTPKRFAPDSDRTL